MTENKKTPLYECHKNLGANIVEFGGWEMPMQYTSGIVNEHLTTRKACGIFDVSHMGRFKIRWNGALPFLQHVLSNNAAALDLLKSQYTIIPDETGGAIDDAYLYKFFEDEYLLVVNASNTQKVWDYFQKVKEGFPGVDIYNATDIMSMISVQGPMSKEILSGMIEKGNLPEPLKNELGIIYIKGTEILVSRTGYTGEPVGFELFMDSSKAIEIWKLLVEKEAVPVGLAARDTLRLEAGLPLYGHELGIDAEGVLIPLYSIGLSQIAVSFSPLKGDFVGKESLEKQFKAFKDIIDMQYDSKEYLPKRIFMLELIDRGIARKDNKVYKNGKFIGYVTSGTMVPYFKSSGEGITSVPAQEYESRAVCLALLDSEIRKEDTVEIETRGTAAKALVVPFFLRSDAPPYARAVIWKPVLCPDKFKVVPSAGASEGMAKSVTVIKKAIANTLWRQQECINLIPSEQTPSRAVRLLSIMDPCCRYAEHKMMEAFEREEIFYYQGTRFISEVECLLKDELSLYLGCSEVEIRLISGQMANMAVFSAIVDFLNRADVKSEQKRIRMVLNHHILKGGHISAQPMGALKEFVSKDPETEKPAVINFPAMPDDPFRIDIEKTKELILEFKPEVIIFGRSLALYREPLKEIRSFIDKNNIHSVLIYDMAHVLGLAGHFFQEPFADGADIVTASTHKTFFGTQRGIVACNFKETDLYYELWEGIIKRVFPGSVSNHHLGTMLGLLVASYEMNYFRDEYQQKIITNAKTFAKALKENGLDVAGDSSISYTETHQVLLNIGYAKGPGAATLLEENNIIVNYQALPFEEGFTASGALRMGVAEMTRFGMEGDDFRELAKMISDVVKKGKNIKEEVRDFRKRFLEMRYCFGSDEIDSLIKQLKNIF